MPISATSNSSCCRPLATTELYPILSNPCDRKIGTPISNRSIDRYVEGFMREATSLVKTLEQTSPQFFFFPSTLCMMGHGVLDAIQVAVLFLFPQSLSLSCARARAHPAFSCFCLPRKSLSTRCDPRVKSLDNLQGFYILSGDGYHAPCV